MPDLQITSPRDGDLLNHHDGHVAADGLHLTVWGDAPPQSRVLVNGRPVNADGGRFACEVILTARENAIEARVGEQRHRITVYWDRHARRRYRFSVDDNIQFLKDLATAGHRSLFDNAYLAFWRGLHQQYGCRVQLNIYWCEPGGFELPHLSDRWRGEWADHADWLKLTFHAEQDLPNCPYLDAPAEQLARDYERINNEILRFAGEATLSPYTTIHWGEATFDGCLALRQRGLAGLAGYFHTTEDPHDGRPAGPRVSYYLDEATTRHVAGRDAWRCHRSGLWFVKHDLVCNTMPPAAIRPHLDSVAANPHRRELMEVMVHEQYFCPFLTHHQPDVQQRVTEAVAWLAEHDYAPIFFEEGFLGSPDESG